MKFPVKQYSVDLQFSVNDSDGFLTDRNADLTITNYFMEPGNCQMKSRLLPIKKYYFPMHEG
ncbi:hypothetical protein SAMN06296273_0997 [Nitrosomonas ureae]|uniref:Uncharacterized protein n=1 Tax=Nitrosomonas ureae TaxID=44577 RepID=A0A285BW87_9PROT|nr:hypothetical protein SAMN06296273_0997 [Nitrosomonas ureae]